MAARKKPAGGRGKDPAGLTHVDAGGRPGMVDVGSKPVTARDARARADVRFPVEVAKALKALQLRTAKGGIVDTAIVAGTLAAKRTHELIPFCHPLPIEGIRIAIEWSDSRTLAVVCEVRATHRTGVEMEAMTGASVAALTLYDMCKALSHDIEIGPLRLLAKHGGKRDFGTEAP